MTMSRLSQQQIRLQSNAFTESDNFSVSGKISFKKMYMHLKRQYIQSIYISVTSIYDPE
jgi:hypothetical protein